MQPAKKSSNLNVFYKYSIMDIVKSLRDFYSNSKHVLGVSYKPDIETFKRTLKVVMLGILVIGALGFVISVIITFITT